MSKAYLNTSRTQSHDTGITFFLSEAIMKKIRCFIRDLYHIATVIGVAFATWKIVRRWRAGQAEKTGHNLDASIKTAAEKIVKTAVSLEKWADEGMGENLGKRPSRPCLAPQASRHGKSSGRGSRRTSS
jgi:hypothetical protein